VATKVGKLRLSDITELSANIVKWTEVKDENDMVSDSSDFVSTQASVKAYVDSQIGSLNIVAKTAAYTASATDDIITCGAGDETFTIDLPAVSSGKVYYIKNVGSGVITVDADTTGSTTIDGDTTQTVNEGECLQVIADGSEYWSI